MPLTINSYDGVYVIKGYVTTDQCDEFIEMIEKSKINGNLKQWSYEKNCNYVVFSSPAKGQIFIDKYVEDISSLACSLFNIKVKLVREQTNWTIWPVGSGRDVHVDNEHKNLWCTSVLYLNDNYSAGEICFPNKTLKIKPQKGDIVLFQPLLENMDHQVIEVEGTSRYTLAVWLQSETAFTQENN
jgi:hypothetical protein